MTVHNNLKLSTLHILNVFYQIIFGSCNQVDGLHQKIVVEIFIEMEKKVQTDFAKRKGKNQSCNVNNEVFVLFGFLLDLHIIEGQIVRSRIVVRYLRFDMSQLFGVDEIVGLSPNIV